MTLSFKQIAAFRSKKNESTFSEYRVSSKLFRKRPGYRKAVFYFDPRSENCLPRVLYS